MFVTQAGGKVMLNGVATVITADIMASNGVVHVVDKVIGLANCNSCYRQSQFHFLSWCFNGSRSTWIRNHFIRNRAVYCICSTNAAFTSLNTELALEECKRFCQIWQKCYNTTWYQEYSCCKFNRRSSCCHATNSSNL
jgi:hypothetical protein